MFVAGFKFALGFVCGLALICALIVAVIASVEWLCSLKERRRKRAKAREASLGSVISKTRSNIVVVLRNPGWEQITDSSEGRSTYLQ
jgi:hypothetical protein